MRVTITCPDCETQLLFLHGDVISSQKMTMCAEVECPICASSFTCTMVMERGLTSLKYTEPESE